MRIFLTKIFWNIEVRAVQKHVHLVDLDKSFPTSIYLQNMASILPRTRKIIRSTAAAAAAENEPLRNWLKIGQYLLLDAGTQYSITKRNLPYNSSTREIYSRQSRDRQSRDGPAPSKRCVKFTHRFLATFCDESAASFNREKMLAFCTAWSE